MNTMTESAVTIADEVSAKMVLGFFDILQLVVLRVALEGITEILRILQCSQDIIHVDHCTLVLVAGIPHPCIWVACW